ncbi:MAG: 7-cyano-7-deazaguanine synthase [Actinobacteria bacterium]|nr:7-cyano-7-deazaguanine synthase [Actinomycetota bacterium]
MAALLVRSYQEVTPLFVRAGLEWEAAERAALQRFFAALGATALRPVAELNLGSTALYGRHWSTGGAPVPDAFAADAAWYLPGRNLLLLAQAATYGAIHEIPGAAIGILASNPFPDARDEFLASFERAASLALDSQFRVLTPLRGMHKAEVIRAGSDLPLELTFSCADPVGDRHCGVCGKCGERRRGFIAAGVEDRTDYVQVGPL